MRRACPVCASLETVIVNNARNKVLAVMDWLLYLPVSILSLIISFVSEGFFWIPDVDLLPITRKCRACGELFRSGKARGRDTRHCRRCDYDLTGNVSGVCPECGEAR